MSLADFSDVLLEQRLNTVEALIAQERDPKNLPSLNLAFQKLLDEQVRRDLEKEDSRS